MTRSGSISNRLRDLIRDAEADRISVKWLLAALQARAFGFLLLFLALPNVIPMPPGLSAVFGILLLYPSFQLMSGAEKPWFPKAIAERELPVQALRAVAEKAGPWLDRLEALARPRLEPLTDRPLVQLSGLICLILAVILILPVFGGNLLPGIAIMFISIGLIQRDGLFVLLSLPFVAASVFVVYLNLAVIQAAIEGLLRLAIW